MDFRAFNKIENSYNPDSNVMPSHLPQVSWVDMELLDLIKGLLVEIDAPKSELKEMKGGAKWLGDEADYADTIASFQDGTR